MHMVHECRIGLPSISQCSETFSAFVFSSKLEFASPKLTLTLINTFKSQCGFRERTESLCGGKCPKGH